MKMVCLRDRETYHVVMDKENGSKKNVKFKRKKKKGSASKVPFYIFHDVDEHQMLLLSFERDFRANQFGNKMLFYFNC